MTDVTNSLAKRFERLELEAPAFRHSDHIQVAYALLDRGDFVKACALYASTIRTMAENVGVPQKFNTTITFAFMSLVAERKEQSNARDFASFIESNPDLLDKNILTRWYSKERLTSAAARRRFLLPDQFEGEILCA